MQVISKLTKILLLVAAICIGVALAWQHYSQVAYDKSVHAQTFYTVDPKAGTLQTNEPIARFQWWTEGLGLIGMLAALFGLPLLIKDITHRQRHS